MDNLNGVGSKMDILNKIIGISVCVVFVNICGISSKTVQLSTTVGDVIGRVSDVTVDGRRGYVREFLGVPYARSPVGELRFNKPVMKEPFRLPFNATTHGAICPQAGMTIIPVDQFKISEDCLNLNIYTPYPVNENDKLSVLVYIHGGAFVTGTANFYVGDVLSYHGNVIVVTLNYRLSIFGFLSTKDSSAPGNYGLWDQHLALKWINKNIASFGGDPGSVTLVGQSVGAISAIYQSLYVGNRGLFHRVIAESGTAVNFGALYSGPMIHDVNFQNMGHMIGCSSVTSHDLVTCLRRKDEDAILSSLHLSFYQIPFGPVYDNDFIKDDPRILLDKTIQQYADIQEFFGSLDMLMGGNSMEGAVYLTYMWKALLMVNNMDSFNVTEQRYRDKVIPSVIQQVYGTPQSDLAVDAIYTRYSDILNPSSEVMLRDMLLKLTTDYMFKVPILKTAMLHSELDATSNTFVYEFLTKPSLTFKNHASPSWLTEANHGDEAEFVFGFSRKMLDALSVPRLYRPTTAEMKLSLTMIKLWTNFAKTGFPNNPDKVLSCPTWQKFDSRSKSYLELSTKMSETSMKTGYAKDSGAFWLEFLPKIVPSIAAKMSHNVHKELAYEDGCENKMASKSGSETRITIVVLSIVAGLFGVGFIVSVYCGLSQKKRANTNYDAVEM